MGLFCVGALAAQTPQTPPPLPQQPTPTFRAGTDIVQLDVSVLDRERQPVRGLEAADFTVLENGKPRPVVAFSAVDIPDVVRTVAPWMHDVASDVSTNDTTVRRIVVIVLDDAYMPFEPAAMKFAKQIGHNVVDNLGPNDLAAVTFTMIGKSQDITTDRQRLNAAIDTLVPHPGLDQRPNPYGAAFSPSSQIGWMGGSQQVPCALRDRNRGIGSCVMDTLIRVGAALRDAPAGRKSLVYISAGIPIDFTIANKSIGDDLLGLQEMFRAMQQANISIYAFDPTGLTMEGMIGPRFDTLRIFAEQTGGRAVLADNAPWDQVPQMFRENSSYYLLGIPSSPGGQGGHRYALQVKVNQADVEVRSRTSYFADPKSARGRAAEEPSALDRVLGSGVPTGDVTMSVTAAPFAAGPRDAAVVVTIGIRPRLLDPPVRSFKVIATAFDQEANLKQRGSAVQTLGVGVSAASAVAPEYQMVSRLMLPRGRYQIRVATEGGGQSGSVFTDVDVPDFAKAPLSLSGLILTNGASAAIGGRDLVSNLLPVVPTVHREFRPGDAASAFLRVYQGGNEPPVSIRVASTIVDERNLYGLRQDRVSRGRQVLLEPWLGFHAGAAARFAGGRRTPADHRSDAREDERQARGPVRRPVGRAVAARSGASRRPSPRPD